MGSIKAFVDSLTAGEIALLAALIGAVPAIIAVIASVLTTRYLLKRGPNYTEHISQIDDTLAMLVQTQEDLKDQQAQIAQDEKERHEATEKRAVAARWKPITKVITKVENNDQANYFRLESTVEFSLVEVSLCTQGGAAIHSFPNDGAKFSSKGFTVTITRDALNKIANNSQTYFQHEYFDAIIRYKVMRDGQEYDGDVPVHAKGVFNNPNMGLALSG